MRANNRINLKWVRGNDVLLKCTLLEPQYNSAGEPIKDKKGNLVWIPLAIDTYDDLTVGLKLMGNTSNKSSSCCCNNDTATADYYSVVSYRGTEEGVLIANIPGTLPTGAYSLEVVGHKNGRSMRAFEGMLFEIVECNGKANVTFDVQEGQKSCDVDIKVQLVSSAVSQGKNAFELWRVIPGNENKTLQEYLDGIVSGESVQSDWNATDGNSPAFIKNKPDIYTKTEVDNKIQEAVDGITPSTPIGNYYVKPTLGIPKSDLASAVQTSLNKADSAVQVEKDPTVPSWAKQPSKPTYQASEVGALSSATTFRSGNSSVTGVNGNVQFKTINGNSIIGSGNIEVEGSGGSGSGTYAISTIYFFDPSNNEELYDIYIDETNVSIVEGFETLLTEDIYYAVLQACTGGLIYRLNSVRYKTNAELSYDNIIQMTFTAYEISSAGIIKHDVVITDDSEATNGYLITYADTAILSFNSATQTLDIVTSSDVTPPTPVETVYRWINDGTVCVGYDKYVKQKRQVSNDSGVTWSDTSETRTGSLIEANSTDCGYNPGGGGDTDDYANQYFTIESWDDNNVISWKSSGTTKTVSVSTNNGSTWTNYTSSSSGTPIATLNANDKILIKGSNSTYGVPGGSHSQFASSKRFNVKGNIMSLINGDNFVGTNILTDSYSFAGLFDGCSQLVYADELILPATTLTSYCYYNMFRGCSMLQTVPELPATTLASYCYSNMFSSCSSINSTPELPATALANSCYLYMFVNCFSLATAKSLPATTLAQDCYNNMFCNCISLTTAPVLPATRLDSNMTGCYAGMFRGCTSLNYIKALIASVYTSSYTSSTDYTRNWVEDVASIGTFIKNSTSSWNVSGVDGIPTGWTVQTASA